MAVTDSLFIAGVKEFALHEIGVPLKGDLYTRWQPSDSPFIYLFVSRADRVAPPVATGHPYIYYNTDSAAAAGKAYELTSQGFQAFCYRSYANSAALLNKRLVSYPPEAAAFIVFHELTHIYIQQLRLRMSYEFNEALADVIGNYGAMQYAVASGTLETSSVKKQTYINEQLYRSFNKCLSSIERAQPSEIAQLHRKCSKQRDLLMQQANSFQKDRFNYPVNNAYLLKNSNYCRRYFLLRSVIIKQQSIKGMLELMQHIPANRSAAIQYLQQLT